MTWRSRAVPRSGETLPYCEHSLSGGLTLDDSAFWDIIGGVRRTAKGNLSRMVSAQRRVLSKLSADDLIGFEQAFNRQLDRAYLWDLWAAAYLMQGGCSDDGFFYFRGWLVTQGQAVYTAAVTVPDSLADLADPEDDEAEERRDEVGEEFLYVARQTYEKLTGREMPAGELKSNLVGTRWEFDDDAEMTRRLPRLARLYIR